MAVLINVEVALLLTALTGSFFYQLWKWFSRAFSGYRLVTVKYYLFQSVLFFFCVPVAFLTIWGRHQQSESWEGVFLMETPVLRVVSVFLICLWLLGAARKIHIIWKRSCLETAIRENTSICVGEESVVLEQVKEVMGISRKIPIYQGDMILSPSLGGVLRPRIFLGTGSYDDKTLRMIFRHELIHYLHKDVLVQTILLALSVVYWFAPAFIKNRIVKHSHEISEDFCDCVVCETEDQREYQSVLLSIAIQGAEAMYYVRVGVSEEKSDVLRRVNQMKRNLLAKPMRRSIVAVLVLLFIFSGSVLSYAAGRGIENGYELIYEATSVEIAEVVEPISELQEYVEAPEDGEDIIIEEDQNEVDLFASVVTINWTVKANIQKQTTGFSMSSGGEIYVAVSVDPSDKYVKVGIIEPDGYKRYVYSKGNIAHTFALNKSGTYRVYVRNENSVDVSVVGYYTK